VKRLFLLLLLQPFLFATLPASEIPADEQHRLAQQFAPVLMFHPEEKYLPCSPEIWRARGGSEGLSGSAYDAASQEEKVRNAVVFYRVFDRGEQRIVEYWLYYVNDTYRAGGGLFPFWSDASHFNDLEFIFLILGRKPASNDWGIKEIIASAHEINNIHKMGTDNPPQRIRFLVELGSHAMAPDLNADGRFTPALEDHSNSKIVWGIRDYGNIWARYSPAYGSERIAPSAISLYPEGSDTLVPLISQPFTYRLESISGLMSNSFEWKDRLPRNTRNWVTRIFGKPDGSSKSLALPPMHPNFGKPGRAENNQAAVERGPFVGYTPILAGYTVFAGYRYTQPSHSRYVPDAVLDSYALLTGNGNDYYEFRMMGTYPVDAITSLLGGFSILGDSIGFDHHQLNWVGGFEVRLNHFRFHSTFRGTGKVSSAWMDFRLMWFF
jgi:hypothetical protein